MTALIISFTEDATLSEVKQAVEDIAKDHKHLIKNYCIDWKKYTVNSYSYRGDLV